eukprot:Sspe_Gene.38533::Locus_18563_Transcript_1_1_Confidence_1.000_Length_592::g.38533::m.38533/K02183/CALM; calmodulin
MDAVQEQALGAAAAAFRQVNPDVISKDQFKKLLKQLPSPIPDHDIESLAAEMGSEVSFPDFIMAVSSALLKGADDDLRRAFAAFEDKGEKGKVNSTKLAYIVSNVGSDTDRLTKDEVARAGLQKGGPIDYEHLLKAQREFRDKWSLWTEVFEQA